MEGVIRPLASSLNDQVGNLTIILSLGSQSIQQGINNVLKQLQGTANGLIQAVSGALSLPMPQLPPLPGLPPLPQDPSARLSPTPIPQHPSARPSPRPLPQDSLVRPSPRPLPQDPSAGPLPRPDNSIAPDNTVTRPSNPGNSTRSGRPAAESSGLPQLQPLPGVNSTPGANDMLAASSDSAALNPEGLGKTISKNPAQRLDAVDNVAANLVKLGDVVTTDLADRSNAAIAALSQQTQAALEALGLSDAAIERVIEQLAPSLKAVGLDGSTVVNLATQLRPLLTSLGVSDANIQGIQQQLQPVVNAFLGAPVNRSNSHSNFKAKGSTKTSSKGKNRNTNRNGRGLLAEQPTSTTPLPLPDFATLFKSIPGIDFLTNSDGTPFNASAFRTEVAAQLQSALQKVADQFVGGVLGFEGVSQSDGAQQVLHNLSKSVKENMAKLQGIADALPHGPVFEAIMGNNPGVQQDLMHLQQGIVRAMSNSTEELGAMIRSAGSVLQNLAGGNGYGAVEGGTAAVVEGMLGKIQPVLAENARHMLQGFLQDLGSVLFGGQ